MFVKNLLQKAKGQNLQHGNMTLTDQGFQVVMHYGTPYTASILAFDAIQRLLAIGTLDGRIKIIGGDNIEALLISPKKLSYKYLEFLDNKGFIIGVSNENDIQVWDLQCRKLSYSLQWEANITAFAVITGTYLMYVGDENGLLSVLKYDSDEDMLLSTPYNIPAKILSESVGVSIPDQQQIVGILPQPGTSGTRVLIAYENGVIILWDVSENHAITVRSSTDLQLKVKECNSSSEASNDLPDTVADEQVVEEICSICWASNSGSILAVGYINGDILLWDLSINSSVKGKENTVATKNVVKLQLSSGDRRVPVIILHWSANAKANSDTCGQLFIYGGDDMGSEEVITVLNLECSIGIDTVKCISRAELNLDGSFADMILVSDAASTNNNSTAALFVLTNPGQINVYDGAKLSMLKSAEEDICAWSEKFPVVVPTIDPCITVTKLCLLPVGRNPSKALLKKAFPKRTGTQTLSGGTKWPLTGGVPGEVTISKDDGIERLYIAGYQDGSVRIWDATHPILSLISVLDGKVPGIKVDGQSASVSALDFCSLNMSLVVGNEFGLVQVYKLQGGTNHSNIHLVNGNTHEVHPVDQEEGFPCTAVFTLSSPIRTLQLDNCGDKLAVGFENGQVAMLDMSSHATSFQTDCLSISSSPVISVAMQLIPQINSMISSPKHPKPENLKEPSEALMFILTKDGRVTIVDRKSSNTINPRPMHTKRESAAISMYVIDGSVSDMAGEKQSGEVDDYSSKSDSKSGEDSNENRKQRIEQHCSDASNSSEHSLDPLLLLCYENAIRLYTLKSVLQGEGNSCHKVNLAKNCCWSTIFKRRDEKSCDLILLYQTGDLEIRSLPDLEVVAGSSLMSILRWSFKTNMEKTMSSYENGQITLVNGCEVAFISLLAFENDFRVPESLPCLHDKVLAAAADAAITRNASQKRKQDMSSSLSGFIKGLKGSRAESNVDIPDSILRSPFSKLEDYFLKKPFLEPSTSIIDSQELSIDDIEIDDSTSAAFSSSNVVSGSPDIKKYKKKEENKEREKLFDGPTNDMKPRVRTTQEIMTKYKFKGDAAAAAAHARDKLSERQEKLERLKKNTEELQSGAENFASLANELVKTMENKKWWKL